ncbi:MAG: radical SAM protein [Desulfobacterota bacterium]|nr:radical SAM protein [Thermodesulfobacteriota bacterium]MDW8001048.1 radical SAM protein [Deltaproteobacteria bacterium]
MDERGFPLRIVAWELTRSCNLECLYCRASATKEVPQGELTTSECKSIIDSIASFSSPIIILTGGEPLLRKDIFEIVEHGSIKKGLHMVFATNGSLLTKETVRILKALEIKRISLSLDGKDKESHDGLRGVEGSFDCVIEATKILNEEGMPFQINTTITSLNIREIESIFELTKSLGACAWHLFFFVPVGRGKSIKDKGLEAMEYEKTLKRIYELAQRKEIEIKVTCAPQYYRILKEEGEELRGSGCLAGKSFMFISHVGVAQPCGYLEIPSGDVRAHGVRYVWEKSEVFLRLRNFREYQGRCGKCRYIKICGGCRARAYEEFGDFMEEEPLCTIS